MLIAANKIDALDVIDDFQHLGVRGRRKLELLAVAAQFLAIEETGNPLFSDPIVRGKNGFRIPSLWRKAREEQL